MNEVFGDGKAELCVLFVVASICQVVGISDLDKARILDAAVHFVASFRREDRLGTTNEVNTIAAFGIAKARGAKPILRAVKHDKLAVVDDDGRIKCASGLPAVALRGKDGSIRCAVPSTENPTRCLAEDKWR